MPTGETPPVDEFVVKVASRCNIACDYCYEYSLGDNTWKTAAKRMSLATAAALASRISDHAEVHGLHEVSLGLHGGEPLLVGPEYLSKICKTLADGVGTKGVAVQFSLQTNGMLIDDRFIDVFERFGITVGVSLDGNESHNDLHRRTSRGVSTYDGVIKGIRRLGERAPHLLGGVLAVIDLRNNPIEVVDALYETGARSIDLMLPHHNWDRPPPRTANDAPDYADWYAEVWTPWIAGRWPSLRIRFLENIVMRLAGHPGIFEQMSLSPATLVTVSTDGRIEGVDTLKSTGTEAQRTSMTIHEHTFDQVLGQEFYKGRCYPLDALSDKCKSCEISDVCVGGYLPHRYSQASGFENPSVYCADLFKLVKVIERDIRIGR